MILIGCQQIFLGYVKIAVAFDICLRINHLRMCINLITTRMGMGIERWDNMQKVLFSSVTADTVIFTD